MRGEAARRYHQLTKHSYWKVRLGPHGLDWANQPIPFKLYKGLEPIPLPRDLPRTGAPALEVVGSPPWPGPGRPTLATLASILFFSAGITKRMRYPGGEIYFRAAACTGALYHIDIYLACGDLEGLEAGVYHFGPHDFSLRQLRRGDYRGVVVEAAGHELSLARASVVALLASTFWRNAWKYRARAYRHVFWDSGTILANMLAMARAHHISARVILGFADDAINHLLGLDGQREAVVALVALGQDGPTGPPPAHVPALHLETVPLSRHEVHYPEIAAVHKASSLADGRQAALWRRGLSPPPTPKVEGRLFPLPPSPPRQSDAIEDVILRRGSTRRFARRPLALEELAAVLACASSPVPSDVTVGEGLSLNRLFLIVNAVEGIPPGAYMYRREEHALELLKEGDFRERAGFLALEQPLGADASVDVFFLSPLDHVLEELGDRGYRAAQLEAGIGGGRAYLAAYALKRGATGLTFYDDEVTSFFSPRAAGTEPMFLVALGLPAYRPRL